MKMTQMLTKAMLLIAILVAPFAAIPAQADDQEFKVEGAIVSRDGNNLLVHSATGNVTLIVNKATEVKRTKGLLGLRSDDMTTDTLIPGLSIEAAVVSSGGQTIAKTIKFDADDLQRATEIQAALAVPQKEAAALKEKVKAQEQVIATQEQQIAASKEQIVANKEQIVANKQEIVATQAQNDAQEQKMAAAQAEVDKRFSELADYDMKDQMTILFDVNSATLSEQTKADLQAFAAKAKTFKGYLIQVAGYADSTGSASLNQNLSDRRAESVANYLRQSCDVGISRVLAPVAMSTAKPVAANETAQGKAENRRVVVKIAVNRGIAQ